MAYNDNDTIDMQSLRCAVEDYYGTATFNGMPAAMLELERVNHMSDGEILREARKLGLLG